MSIREGLYAGEVVHARLRPVAHKLRYPVFSLLVDCSRLDALGQRLRVLSHNGANIFSLRDDDHGDGRPLPAYLQSVAADAGLAGQVRRFMMLCYPRMLGFVFNPITVYYGLDDKDEPVLMIYEVNNTFGQGQTYVLPVVDGAQSVISQSCDKSFYVSPFNNVEGEYLFHVTRPGDDVTIGVALKTDGEALLRAHFRGERHDLTDASLLRALARFGWMSVNVVAGIHWEAAKLWLKGMPLKPRPKAPRKRTVFVPESTRSISRDKAA